MSQRKPDLDDRGSDDKSRTELDVYDKALRSSDVDTFLESENLGLGFYEDAERWQQVESYRYGMFGDEAFGEALLDRAVHETKRQLALRGTSFYDTDANAPSAVKGWADLSESKRDELREEERIDRRRYVESQMDEIWKQLTERKRIEAIEIATGVDRKWTPPHWKMLMARHETSRSRDARLLDNLFGRKSVQEVHEHRTSDSSGGLLPGRSNNKP